MRSLVLGFVVLMASPLALAYENRFIVNNDSKITLTDVSFGRAEGSVQNTQGPEGVVAPLTNYSAQIMRLGLTQALDEMWVLRGGLKFQNKTFIPAGESFGRNVFELSSLTAGAKGGVTFEPATLVYGLDAEWNTGIQQADPLYGFDVYTPYVGLESYVGKFALGGRVFLNAYASRGRNTVAERRGQVGLDAFLDVPIAPRVNLGFALGAARADSEVQRFVAGSAAGNEYVSELKGEYQMDSQTRVRGGISSRNDSGLQTTNTEMSLGFTRNL